MKVLKKVLLILAILLAVILLWVFGSIYAHRQSRINEADKEQSATEQENLLEKEDVKPEELGEENTIEPLVKDEIVFLLAGLDSNNDGGITLTRTDTLVLFKVNFDDGKITMVSIPRDSRVPVKGKLDKINHASAYEGIGLTMRTIRDYFDIDLDYYVKMNFESVKRVVDTIGGITIDVPSIIAQGTGLPQGNVRLNGEQALKYVRYRKGYTSGDVGRVEAQQKFLKALVKEVTKLENIPKLPVMADTIMGEVDTNIPFRLVFGHIPKVNRFRETEFETHLIPGHGEMIDGLSYYIIDEEGAMRIMNDVFGEYRLNQD